MAVPRVAGLLAANIFLSGAAFAAMTPYRAIVGVETLGLSNAAFGMVMALNALGGALIATFLGWLSDRVRDRRILVLICAVAGAFGFTLVWAVRTPVGFATAFCLLVPFGNALFSQSFSYSRAFFDREWPPRSELAMSYLRTGFSIAWIIVPPLAGWLAARTDAYAVFAISAAAHVGCTLTVVLLWVQPESRVGRDVVPKPGRAEQGSERPTIAPGYRFGIAGVALSMVGLQLNISVLPLFIVRDLNGTLGQVGINSAFAAAIEVPVMIGWGYAAMRWRKESILAIACTVFALYFALVGLADSFVQVLLLQCLAGVAIAALLSINISYLQEAIPGRVGLSTSLVDVTNVIASLSAAAIFAANPWDTYWQLMMVAAAVCLAGAGLMLRARG